MNDPDPRGRPRIDLVLSEDFASDLRGMALDTLRERRREARREEADLSYVRRILQGRIDLARAELRRRDGEPVPDDVIARLREVLADEPPRVRASARHLAIGPSRVGDFGGVVEHLLSDVQSSDLRAVGADTLRGSLAVLVEQERQVSDSRRAVQHVIDCLSEEVTRRYRDGEAHVDDLLTDDVPWADGEDDVSGGH